MFYFEQKAFDGSWRPQTVPEKPDIVEVNGNARLKRAEGVGPKVRGVKPVPTYYRHLTLAQMQNVLSKDGKLRAVAW